MKIFNMPYSDLLKYFLIQSYLHMKNGQVTKSTLNSNYFTFLYCKNYQFVPLPFSGHRETPSINLTLPSPIVRDRLNILFSRFYLFLR